MPPHPRSPVETHGPWVLLAAAVAAWTLAVILRANEAVATAFEASGATLVLAAVFFSRVRKVGKDGIELDPDRALGAALREPLREGDTPEEARVRALDAVSRNLEVQAGGRPRIGGAGEARRDARAVGLFDGEPSFRRAMMERDRREANLQAGFGNWLSNQGYTVDVEPSDDSRVRVDLVATRGDQRILAEIRPTIEALNLLDASAIVAHRPTELRPVPDGRAVVFADGTEVHADAAALLQKENVAIYLVDIDTGAVRVPETTSS